MIYGMNNYTFSAKTPAGFQNITINAKTDKEAFAIVSNHIGPDDHILSFSTERCCSTAGLIHDYLHCEYNSSDGVLKNAQSLFGATPEWWENMLIEYADLGIGDNACWLDKPVTYEMLDDAITDFIIDTCVHFFHAEDRFFCMIDFTLINDGEWFTFPNGEVLGSTVIDDWCWEGGGETDADLLAYFGDKIHATINSFLVRIRA